VPAIFRRAEGDGTGLFGPLLGYDLVRTARRHIILHRCLYLVGIALVLYLIYLSWSSLLRSGGLFDAHPVDSRELSRFAESFFTSFVLLQFAVVSIVTPAYAATALASEKANRTLELLLATHLTSREIVLGILASRLGTLFLLLLTGVPILCLLPFFGGVDPRYVFASFVVLLATTVSVGSMSVLVSIHARNPLAAVLGAYSACIPYVIFGALLPLLAILKANDEVDVVGCTISYILVHGAVAVVCLNSAISGLRAAACATPAAPRAEREHKTWENRPRLRGATNHAAAVEPPRPQTPWRILPAVQDDALLWKEMNQRPLFLANETKETVTAGLVTFLGIYGLVVLGAGADGFDKLLKASNILVRVLAIFPACIALMAIAFNGANRILREREQHTLDSLLMIPVARWEILVAKFKACILSYRWVGLIIAAVWLLGLLTGGLSVAAVPTLLLAACVYVALLANLGLWFSSWCRTTMRAMLATSITAAFLLAGPGIVWRITMGLSLEEEPASWLALLSYRGLSPILNLWTLSFGYDGIEPRSLLAAVAGVVCHGLLAFGLWRLLGRRFRGEKGPRALEPTAEL
jgi:ABC-type transport system involved in multi-copper enzyme maturation permease subunit